MQCSSKSELTSLLEEAKLRDMQAELARRSLIDFIGFTKRDFFSSQFAQEVCDALDQFIEDVKAEKRPILILQAPPQHGKSEIVSRRLPPYIFGRWPDARIASCSYGADLARDMNRDVQGIMMSEEYKQVFPETWLNPKRTVTVENQALRNSDRFDIMGRKGYYICAGTGGPLTGKSVDIGIIDDPIKNETEARSPTYKARIQGWYESVFLTRLSRCSGIIIMATSWATDDLAGTILKNNPKAKHLKFKAINDNGKALVPELHPIEKLLEVKALLSSTRWSAMFQQSPVAEGGNVFKKDWIKRYTAATLPAKFDEEILSWDLTFKDKKTSDFVVGQAWGRVGASYYLLGLVRDRMNFPESVKAVKKMVEHFPNAHRKLIEDKANGPALISTLEKEIHGLIPINPQESKLARAHCSTAAWEAGNVYLPEEAPWLKDFEDEFEQFDKAPHDDQIDAMTQAIIYFTGGDLAVWEALGAAA